MPVASSSGVRAEAPESSCSSTGLRQVEPATKVSGRGLRRQVRDSRERLPTSPRRTGSNEVALYVVQVAQDAEVVLDDEHDQFLWLSLEDALPKCLTSMVASGLANAAAWIESRS